MNRYTLEQWKEHTDGRSTPIHRQEGRADYFSTLAPIVRAWHERGFTVSEKMHHWGESFIVIRARMKSPTNPDITAYKEMYIYTSSKKISDDLRAATALYQEVAHNQYTDVY